jgi:ketosteroid isomerase-like protein
MGQLEITDDDLGELVERIREAAAALMQGDARRYFALVNEAPDFTLMPPTGGPIRRGPDTSPAGIEALEKFFAGAGAADFELEQSYAAGNLVVLAGVERQHGIVGGLPDQDWSLRVTLVFRREGSDWRLVHRHADALVQPIGMAQLSLLARGAAEAG